jgi:hypothetical protein
MVGTGKFRQFRFVCSDALRSQWWDFPIFTRSFSCLPTALFRSTQIDFPVYPRRYSGLHTMFLRNTTQLQWCTSTVQFNEKQV